MKVLIKFFTGIMDAVNALLDFVIGMIEDTVYIVTLVGRFVLKIPSLFTWLPAPVVALIVSMFSIVVIYKILGREG